VESNEDRKNREINFSRGEAVNRLITSNDWQYILDIRKDLINDLYKGLFMSASEGKPLYLESTYAQVLANRHGVIEGINNFFSLLEKLNGVYLHHKRGE